MTGGGRAPSLRQPSRRRGTRPPAPAAPAPGHTGNGPRPPPKPPIPRTGGRRGVPPPGHPPASPAKRTAQRETQVKQARAHTHEPGPPVHGQWTPVTRPQGGQPKEGELLTPDAPHHGPGATSHRPSGTQRPADHAHQNAGPPRLHGRAHGGWVADPDHLAQRQAAGREWAPHTARPRRRQARPSWGCWPRDSYPGASVPATGGQRTPSARSRGGQPEEGEPVLSKCKPVPRGSGTTPGYPRNAGRQPAGGYIAGPVPGSHSQTDNDRHGKATEDPYLIPALRHSNATIAETTA